MCLHAVPACMALLNPIYDCQASGKSKGLTRGKCHASLRNETDNVEWRSFLLSVPWNGIRTKHLRGSLQQHSTCNIETYSHDVYYAITINRQLKFQVGIISEYTELK